MELLGACATSYHLTSPGDQYDDVVSLPHHSDWYIKVSKGALVVRKAHRIGNLYKVVGRTQVNGSALVSEEESGPTQLWHQCLGHMSEIGLHVLMNCKLLQNLKTLNLIFCKHCLFGKQRRQKFKVGSHVSKGVLDYIHSDFWGLS